MAVILVEYTSEPVMFVLVIALVVFFTINGLITEPTPSNEESLLDNNTQELSHIQKGLDSSLLSKLI